MSRLTRILLLTIFLVFSPFLVRAAVCDDSTVVKVIARDPSGAFIPGASVEIYTQANDVDGNPKPDKKMAAGTISSTLGSATLTFKNSEQTSAVYALKIRTVAKDSANFWFYDNTLTCGGNSTISKTLSGLELSFYQSDGSVLSNTKFSVYTQLLGSDGSLLEQKNELLGSFTSGSAGRSSIYLPQGSVRSLDGSLGDYYVLEVTDGAVKSLHYNLRVQDGQMTKIDYKQSVLRLRLKYSGGGSAVGQTVEVYTQKLDAANKEQIDTKVGSFTIAENGYGSLEVAPGTYALRVKSAGEYQYFWDLNVSSGGTTQFFFELKGSETSAESTTACTSESKVYLTLRDIAGNVVPNLKFELYEQTSDANGLPIAGTKVANGTTDTTGRATMSFKPDSAQSYALKVWDKKDNLGNFWFFGVVKFVCGYDRNLNQSLPALKIVLRDSNGQPKYNHAFSLYVQRYDVDGNPVFSNTDLIASLKTGSDGQAVVYVSPYNAYNNSQSGVYAISTKDDSGNIKNFYDLRISEVSDYTFDPSFSGLKGEYVDLRGRAMANKTLSLYEQKADGSYLSLGKKLFSFKTDSSGSFSFDYPQGTYAILASDDFSRDNVFWNVVIGSGSAYLKLTPSLITFKFSAAGFNAGQDIPLQLYALNGQGGTYSKGELIKNIKLNASSEPIILAAGTYLATYTAASGQVFGQAFYAKNNTSYTLNLSPTGQYLLGEKKSFALRNADSNLAVKASGNTNTSAGTNSSLVSRVKGRILLQVEDKGQAWYVNPIDSKRYGLGKPEDAFNVMRQTALGISNVNFSSLEKNPANWKHLAGRILLKTEDSGRAYYFDPVSLKLHYLGRPEDAFNIMRTLGLGITNSDLNQISSN